MNNKKIERLLSVGKFDEALRQLESTDASAWRDMSYLKCLRQMGRRQDALALANELYSHHKIGEFPYPANTSERLNQLRYIAQLFAEFGRAQQACDILRILCDDNLEVAALHKEYAYALTCNSQLDEAEEQLNIALSIQPDNANCQAQLARILCRSGRVNAGYNNYSKAASLDPKNPNYIQRLLYWSNFSERTTQQANYQLTRLWASIAHPQDYVGTNKWRAPNPTRRLKLALISSNLRDHPTSYLILPLLRAIDRNRFHISVFSDTRKRDTLSSTIQELSDHWQDTSQYSDRQVAHQITQHQIDVLLDLHGHSAGNRLNLFAKHLAPLQISWLGYPSTTGMKSIDYRITDRIADPIGVNDEFFTERLIRLSNGFLCYEPPADAPEIAPSDNQGVIRFGSFNSLSKISSETLDCWAAAMLAVPHSTLCLKRKELTSENAREGLIAQLEDRGIVKDRLIFKSKFQSTTEHLAEYNHIDIAFDTSPYNGTTTTLQALWMGVPVVSLTGQTHASRVSTTILERINLGGMATKSVMDFAMRAKELSELEETRQQLRGSLRRHLADSPLMNKGQFAREFESAVIRLWQEWCEQRIHERKQTVEASV